MTQAVPFEEYLASLAPFAPEALGADPAAVELCERATGKIQALISLDRTRLAEILADDPAIAPVLAAVVGLSQERFKTWLQARFSTAGWVKLARQRSAALIDALDDDLGLLTALEEESQRRWTWGDVLARVMSPRQRAGQWVRQGRELEDAVEARLHGLGLPYEPRTRFRGRAGRTGPVDFAIPTGEKALIMVAVKGFDSTGSKLSDATREIEEMAEVKTPRQFIFAVVDGQGWLRRQSDLRRIHTLWEQQLIDGLFTRSQLDVFADAVLDATTRLGIR